MNIKEAVLKRLSKSTKLEPILVLLGVMIGILSGMHSVGTSYLAMSWVWFIGCAVIYAYAVHGESIKGIFLRIKRGRL